MVKSKVWRDAKEFYTKAIAVLTGKSEAKWEKGEDPESQAKKEKELEEQCFINRALCHLELSAYGVSVYSEDSAYSFQGIIDQQPLIVPPLSGSTRTTSKPTIAQH
jgi:hypothetical protein